MFPQLVQVSLQAFHSACLFETKENILSIISKHGQDIDFDVVPLVDQAG